ncbi:hypothetical protein AAC387_Pa07g2446 [Persea americana]
MTEKDVSPADIKKKKTGKPQTEKTTAFTWKGSHFTRDQDRRASFCFAKLPSPSDKDSIISHVPVGVLQCGDEASPANPQPEIIGVTICRFTEVVCILDVKDTEANPQDSIQLHYPHNDFVAVGEQLAGAQVPLPETVPKEWVKGEPDPCFHDSDKPKRHPAIVEDEAIVRAIRSNLYVGRDMVQVPKDCDRNLVS